MPDVSTSEYSAAQLPGPGDELGDYRLTATIGEGSMGSVFRAVDMVNQRDVAIKFLNIDHQSLSDEQAAEIKKRFIQEARLLDELQHPNLVRTYGHEFAPPYPYMVMEYLPGVNLQVRSQQPPPLDYDEICRIVGQVVDVLKYAWESKQIIHRDLKPSNIMFFNPESVKLVDLGIAKAMTTDVNFTQFKTRAGTMVGTYYFMSPEQHLGETQLDNRSDIYSLGVLLCELCTGRLPFQGRNQMEIFYAKEKGLPDGIRQFAPELPSGINDLICRMLKLDRDERVSSYAEIADILEQGRADLAASQTSRPGAAQAPAPTTSITLEDSDNMAETVIAYSERATAVNSPPPERPKRPGEVGAIVGSYILMEFLGEGNLGVVYRAESTKSDEQVAIKLFKNHPFARSSWPPPNLDDLRQSLCSLDHRSLCGIHDIGSWNGYVYAVSDLLLGPGKAPMTFSDFCLDYGVNGCPAEKQMLKIARLTLESLAFAHAHDVYHGNLKPDNILVNSLESKDGYLRTHFILSDIGWVQQLGGDSFGSVVRDRLVDSGPISTRSAANACAFDSHAFMSPEMRDGTDEIRVATDIYSVGLILLRGLTGHIEIDSGTRASSLRPDICPDWDPIIGKALRPSPERRFKSAEEMLIYVESVSL